MTGLVKDRLLGCMRQIVQQGVDRIGEVYGTGFTVGSLARVGARDGI